MTITASFLLGDTSFRRALSRTVVITCILEIVTSPSQSVNLSDYQIKFNYKNIYRSTG